MDWIDDSIILLINTDVGSWADFWHIADEEWAIVQHCLSTRRVPLPLPKYWFLKGCNADLVISTVT